MVFPTWCRPNATSGQSPATVERDKEICDELAIKRTDGLAYQSACLIGKGYRIYVAFTKGGQGQAQFTVLSQRQQTADQTLQDLLECGQAMGARIEGRPAGGIFVNQISEGVAIGEMEGPVIGCMGPRGYSAARWLPRRVEDR